MIELKYISKSFGNGHLMIRVLEGIDLSIKPDIGLKLLRRLPLRSS